jgi:hypothetical protein
MLFNFKKAAVSTIAFRNLKFDDLSLIYWM